MFPYLKEGDNATVLISEQSFLLNIWSSFCFQMTSYFQSCALSVAASCFTRCSIFYFPEPLLSLCM